MKYNLQSLHLNIDVTSIKSNIIVQQIPYHMFDDGKTYVIPTLIFNIIKEQMNNGNNNYTFVKPILEIIQTLYANDNCELSSHQLKKISNKYLSIIEMLKPIIYSVKYSSLIDGKRYKKNIYTMRSFSDLTFVKLSKSEQLKINSKRIENSPVNNTNFIYVLENAKIDIKNVIRDEFEYVFNELNDNDLIIEYNYSNNDRYKLFLMRISNALKFNSNRWVSKGKKIDRVFSSFSSLTRIARKHVHINGKYFTEIDGTNYAPLLLNILMVQNNLAIDDNYILHTTNGILYERLKAEANALNIKSEFKVKSIMVDEFVDGHKYIKNKKIHIKEEFDLTNRDHIKILVCSDILYSNLSSKGNMITTNFCKIFKSLYPKTYESIRVLKLNGDLNKNLNNLEADINLNVIPNCYYFDVHDAKYLLNTNQLNFVKKSIKTKINELSNGIVKKIPFKIKTPVEYKYTDKFDFEYDFFEYEFDDSNNIDMNLNKNHKDHKPSSSKINRFESFKRLMNLNKTKTEIINEMNINRSTYFRYLKQFKSI